MSFMRVMLGLCIVSAMALVLAGYFGVETGAQRNERVAALDTDSQTDAASSKPDGPSLGQLIRAFGIATSGNGGGLNTVGGGSNRITTPEQATRKEFYGWKIRHPGMIGPNDEVAMLNQALDGYPITAIRPEVPATVAPIEPLASCTPRRPASGEAIVNVQVNFGGAPTGVHALSKSELAKQTMEWIGRIQSRQSDLDYAPRTRGNPVEAKTVVLTDTSAPQYLILQSSDATIWNVQAAPGVKIAHVAMIGRPGMGFHGPAGDYGIEPLLLSTECAPAPARAPAPHWDLYARPGALNRSNDYEGKAKERHQTYTTWFEATFGIPSEQGAIGGWEASHVFAGPVPTAPFPYFPMEGAIVRAVPAEHMYHGNEDQIAASLREDIRRLGTAATGGDLSILQPTPTER